MRVQSILSRLRLCSERLMVTTALRLALIAAGKRTCRRLRVSFTCVAILISGSNLN